MFQVLSDLQGKQVQEDLQDNQVRQALLDPQAHLEPLPWPPT